MKAFTIASLLILSLLLTVALSSSSGQNDEKAGKSITERITSPDAEVRAAAYKDILAERSATIKDLLKILETPVLEPDNFEFRGTPRNIAITLLGEMRATEAIAPLMEWFFPHPQQLHFQLIDMYEPFAVTALIKIGKPASVECLKRLALKDNEKVARQSLKRDLLLRVIRKVEGDEVAKFMLQNAIEKEQDKDKKANLAAALDTLNERIKAEKKTEEELRKQREENEKPSAPPAGESAPAGKGAATNPASDKTSPAAQSQRPSPRPVWQAEDWWITETHVLTNISQLDGVPSQLADRLFYHKWSVAGKEKVEKVECWVVEIRAHNLPKDVVDDHKGDYLVRLYLNKDDYSLVKLERNHRRGTYNVTGATVDTSSQSFEKGESVIVTSWPIMCPLDVPKLPDSWCKMGIMEKEKEINYVDEWTGDNAIQRIQPFSTDPKGKSPAMLITLIRKEWPIRTMLWLPDRPWWSEWRCQTADGKIENVWYSKMIDWKGKAEAANKNPEETSQKAPGGGENSPPAGESKPAADGKGGTPPSGDELRAKQLEEKLRACIKNELKSVKVFRLPQSFLKETNSKIIGVGENNAITVYTHYELPENKRVRIVTYFFDNPDAAIKRLAAHFGSSCAPTDYIDGLISDKYGDVCFAHPKSITLLRGNILIYLDGDEPDAVDKTAKAFDDAVKASADLPAAKDGSKFEYPAEFLTENAKPKEPAPPAAKKPGLCPIEALEGYESGKDAAKARQTVSDLADANASLAIRILTLLKADLPAEQKAYICYLAGEYRSPIYVKELCDVIDIPLPASEKDESRRPRFSYYPAVTALINIGRHAALGCLERLAADEGKQSKLINPYTKELFTFRELYLKVVTEVEGREVTKFMLQRAIETAKDKDKKANLSAALALLEKWIKEAEGPAKKNEPPAESPKGSGEPPAAKEPVEKNTSIKDILLGNDSEAISKLQLELTEERERTISDLIFVLDKSFHKTSGLLDQPGIAAAHLLGELRAKEAVKPLADKILHGTIKWASSPAKNNSCYAALVRIGKPASLECMERLASEKFEEPREGMLGRQELYLMVVQNVEGDDVARLMLQRAIEMVKDKDKKANLAAALAVLEKWIKEREELEKELKEKFPPKDQNPPADESAPKSGENAPEKVKPPNP